MSCDEASNTHGKGKSTNLVWEITAKKVPFVRCALRRKDKKAIYDTNWRTNTCIGLIWLRMSVSDGI
jgi:hypothetical protein